MVTDDLSYLVGSAVQTLAGPSLVEKLKPQPERARVGGGIVGQIRPVRSPPLEAPPGLW